MSWTHHISLDAASYPIQAVRQTVYSVADRLSILVKQEDNLIHLKITPAPIKPNGIYIENAADAELLLIRHLNDFVLREQISMETQGIRELLAKAALKECGI